MHFSMQPPRLQDSAIVGVINGAINGVIAWSAFQSSESVPLSMDSIGTPGVTALGNAATVAFMLAFIVTCITFLVYRRAARRSGFAPTELTALAFLPTGVRIAAVNTCLMFGAFVALAVLWQRFAGTVFVGPWVAALVVAAVAFIATVVADWRTKRAMMLESAIHG